MMLPETPYNVKYHIRTLMQVQKCDSLLLITKT